MRPMRSVRILFFADTHLGFDYPLHPRVERRRRGDDFFANYQRAIDTARREEVDFVIHGGDLFYRSKIPQAIVIQAFEPLVELAAGGLVIALSGFPYRRDNIRKNFHQTLEEIRRTIPDGVSTDVRLLCMHHIVEGARIGVFDYTFRVGSEVIRGDDIPPDFDVVLSGHIHRFQILTMSLRGKPLPAQVYYPGSIERTSFAERNEVKGYLILEIGIDETTGRPLLSHQFIPLPARPMVAFDIHASALTEENLEGRIRGLLQSQDVNSVVRISICGSLTKQIAGRLNAEFLRDLAPDTMNVTLSFPGRLPHVDEAL